jgi:hypothetical protein
MWLVLFHQQLTERQKLNLTSYTSRQLPQDVLLNTGNAEAFEKK